MEHPIRKAIDFCIEKHILEDFLREHRAEVERAMAIDMSYERREELFRKEEREFAHAEDIINLMKNMNLTADQAMQALGIAEEERAKYIELLNKSQ